MAMELSGRPQIGKAGEKPRALTLYETLQKSRRLGPKTAQVHSLELSRPRRAHQQIGWARQAVVLNPELSDSQLHASAFE